MKKYFIYGLMLAGGGLAACTGGKKETSADEKQALISRIDSIHHQLFDPKTMEFDKNLAFQGIGAYEEYVKRYPEDSLSAEYLFRASDLSRAVGDGRKAIGALAQICKDYPKYKKIPECLFLQGYYYQDLYKDTVSAKRYYEELLSRFPNHAFADDAKALMSSFGKTDEQLIKEFEEKQKAEKKN